MRPNALSRHAHKALSVSLLLAALSLVLFASSARRNSAASPPPAAFQTLPKPWTAVGSTGAVDESSINEFASVSTEIGFRKTSSAKTLVARYNVTNTFDNNSNPNQPGWHTLEMGSTGVLDVIIQARLYEVNACNAAQTLLCTAVNRSNDSPCARCTFNGPVDFTRNLYYVEVTLDRSAAIQALPRVFTLRVF